MAEGTPLERVQVVNSGARVQIPPSPFVKSRSDFTNKLTALVVYFSYQLVIRAAP